MRKQKGQVGLLIVIVVGVLVALIMSVASGTLSDVVLSRQAKEGGTAFHLAEQGVEEALNSIRQNADLGSSAPYQGQVSFNNFTGQYSVEQDSGLDVYVQEGDVIEIDLTNQDVPSHVNVEWVKDKKPDEDVACQGEGSGHAPAALEIIRLLDDGTINKKYVNAAGCNLNNNFVQGAQGSGSYKNVITLAMGGVKRLRLRPIYNGATIRISSALLHQIYLIRSKANKDNVDKEIEVKRSRDRVESLFDFALFTNGTIVK